LANHLAPPARRDAEVDHAPDALEKPETLVELEQLVRGPAAIAFGLGLLDVGVVELALEPPRRGRRAPASRPDTPVHILSRAAHSAPFFRRRRAVCAAKPSASAAMRPRRMPSRMPRSATPSRGAGQRSRMVSRIAHPATTRSARSLPMQ